MRLLSWNVRDLLGDPLAVHRVIRAGCPDLVCLQEAPRRPGARVRLHLLGRATGLVRVVGGRSSGGTAILARPGVRVADARAFRLQVPGRLARTRGACVATCALPGVTGFAVACVHLPLEAGLRLRHAAEVAAVVHARGLPAVVAGDLNEPPGAPAWGAWAPLAVDPWPDAAPTFPARRPATRLDAVLVGPAVLAVPEPAGWCHTWDVERASDHLPVLATLAPAQPSPAAALHDHD
ncbi:MAG TPA: endonuclease/exonuclease/phosphatase family protein [Kineosporiaceae bacterium]